MNLKEFLDWRSDCFFCREELYLHPETAGLNTEFSLTNNIFNISSRYVNFSFDIISGVIETPVHTSLVDVVGFFKQQGILIRMRCHDCNIHTHRSYVYSGCFKGDMETGKIYLSSMSETVVVVNKYFLVQDIPPSHPLPDPPLSMPSCIRAWSNRPLTFNSMGQGLLPTTTLPDIKVPYINLLKTTPEALENKIKTYFLFS